MTLCQIFDTIYLVSKFQFVIKGDYMTLVKRVNEVEVDDSSLKINRKPDLSLARAITLSVVTVLAVAVGTIYGTILF